MRRDNCLRAANGLRSSNEKQERKLATASHFSRAIDFIEDKERREQMQIKNCVFICFCSRLSLPLHP